MEDRSLGVSVTRRLFHEGGLKMGLCTSRGSTLGGSTLPSSQPRITRRANFARRRSSRAAICDFHGGGEGPTVPDVASLPRKLPVNNELGPHPNHSLSMCASEEKEPT